MVRVEDLCRFSFEEPASLTKGQNLSCECIAGIPDDTLREFSGELSDPAADTPNDTKSIGNWDRRPEFLRFPKSS